MTWSNAVVKKFVVIEGLATKGLSLAKVLVIGQIQMHETRKSLQEAQIG